MPKMDLDIINRVCNIYRVDPDWVSAIITVESEWNTYAVRYESSYSYLFTPQKFAQSGQVSLSTEIATQKMSWGLGQIMGALAREQGHKGVMPELCEPELNVKHMCIRIAELKKRAQGREDVFAAYNGGLGALKLRDGIYSNQGYVNRVSEALEKLS